MERKLDQAVFLQAVLLVLAVLVLWLPTILAHVKVHVKAQEGHHLLRGWIWWVTGNFPGP